MHDAQTKFKFKFKFSFEREMEKSGMSLKLLIDIGAKRVLFAEGGKECVDFLFHLLSVPVATIVRLLGYQGMEGSLPKLYQSLQNLDTTYIETGKNKDAFLNPVSSSSVKLLGVCDTAHTPNETSYKCTQCPRTYSISRGYCKSCGSSTGKVEETSGVVKGVVTYMVMDDLEVKPMSTISSLTLLNQFHVKDIGALKEKVVTLGMDEGLKLLKASLQSKTVLTDVFC